MVPQTSAISAGKIERSYDQLSIDADHSDIVKFSDPSNPDYVIIKSRIMRLVGDAPRVIQERIADYRKSKPLLINEHCCQFAKIPEIRSI
jgi:hypothetical protein